jgi:hypothetical protein
MLNDQALETKTTLLLLSNAFSHTRGKKLGVSWFGVARLTIQRGAWIRRKSLRFYERKSTWDIRGEVGVARRRIQCFDK